MYKFLYKTLETIKLFIPCKHRKNICYLIEQLKENNRENIKNNNKNRVINKIREKLKNNEKINVAFLVFNSSKWKNQSIFNVFKENQLFNPYILISKKDLPEESFDKVQDKELADNFNFFKNKGIQVYYAYDFDKNDWISLDDVNPKPDIVYYCEPWSVHKSQYPLSVNNYAITCYSPYYTPNSKEHTYVEYALDFHQDIQVFYVPDDETRDTYSKNMKNKGKNLVVAGHPTFDYFYLNKEKKFENKNTIIYAPHYSVDKNSIFQWGTFLENGDFILNWAKNHPEFSYIFKPHPSLKGYLLKNNLKTEEYIEKYWDDWSKIGLVYESGDYFDMFMESKAMITDCGSFKTEYFMTKKPQFYPVSKGQHQSPVLDVLYQSKTLEELENNLNEVLIKGNDYKKDARLELYEKLGYGKSYCAQNILNHIKKIINI